MTMTPSTVMYRRLPSWNFSILLRHVSVSLSLTLL